MRLRFQEFLYLLLLLAGAALSYSPLHVLWTGFCIVVFWSAGFLLVFHRPETLTFAEAAAGLNPVPSEVALRVVLNPTFVGVSQLWNQVVLTAIMTGLLAAAVWRARETLRRQSRAEVARADLSRYVSPDVADAMMAASEHRFGEPATRRVAVLFADIVGFTGLAETLPPERVVTLLASFHTRACAVVFRHGGTLDKFLGDGLMATFGALGDDPDAPRKALACAFELQAEMDRWCAKRAGRGASEVFVAIGVHCGPVVVGNIGAERRLEFTVIGDAVNVANRLERLTRELGCRIAVSRECLDAARGLDPARFEAKGAVALRGRAEPVEVFAWPPSGATAPSR
jgi:adenylate cyclase